MGAVLMASMFNPDNSLESNFVSIVMVENIVHEYVLGLYCCPVNWVLCGAIVHQYFLVLLLLFSPGMLHPQFREQDLNHGAMSSLSLGFPRVQKLSVGEQ